MTSLQGREGEGKLLPEGTARSECPESMSLYFKAWNGERRVWWEVGWGCKRQEGKGIMGQRSSEGRTQSRGAQTLSILVSPSVMMFPLLLELLLLP